MSYILKIKSLLKEKNLTQIEFANNIGVTKTTVNNYLTGKTKIDIETFIKIAKTFNVPIGYFFEENELNKEDTRKLLETLKTFTFLANRRSKDYLNDEYFSFLSAYSDPVIDIFEIITKEQKQLLYKYGYISDDLMKVLKKIEKGKKAPKNSK